MCNGLCCYAEPHKDGSGPTYFVCNPASGQTRTARILEPQANWKLIAVNLAFDPLKSAFYNLIFVTEESRSLGSQKMIRIDIYSSETQSRRQVLVSVSSNAGFKNGVYWDGAIYWYHQQRNSMSYFDIEVGVCVEPQNG
ncbi:F-box protein [Pyrus ussuriensis x Pyrus communis]|uniref:F-box protein n=1 Tax=Pyrus ussuriensis x Pyrus communis TaxID=2448454 RepID=A0A5N5FNZ1_9ROSA|nr:F-box protein [Pyrus ussuriensis x Pyrus communis]